MIRTDNRNLFTATQGTLDRLIGPDGTAYNTTPGTRPRVPLYLGCLGLNVIHDDTPEITRNAWAMLSVGRGPDWLTARLWAVCDRQTGAYNRPGIIHRQESTRLAYLMVIEPDMYDGYELVATTAGEVSVVGLQRSKESNVFGADALPVFADTCATTATALFSAVHRVLAGRAESLPLPRPTPAVSA